MKYNEIIEELNRLSVVSGKLDPSESQRTEWLNELKRFSDLFISRIDEVKGFRNGNASHLEIDGKTRTITEALDLYQREVVHYGINAASGMHLGYIPGGGIFASALADFLAAVTNPYAGVYYASPGAASIENEVINWLKSVFSYPQTAVGSLTSGGSVSTLIAFTAARDHHGVKNEHIRKHVVYLSEQVHHSTQKALRIIGLEDLIIRYIPIDERHRMRVDLLETQIATDRSEGLFPFMVVASAGTTDTGAMDPLDGIADVSEKNNMWFHVDAAYGGFFILTSKKNLFKGIERADSLIVDPHKGLFLPYGLGAVLIRDKKAALHSNHYTANYMQDAVDEELVMSPSNLSPELTRHFRGLRLWLPLQLHGVEPFIACLEEKILLTSYFRNRLMESGFETGPEPDLSVSYFWYPFEENCDALNRQLMDEIHQDGDVFLSSSMIDGRYVIRMAILAFRTKKHTIDRAVEMIKRCLAQIKTTLNK